MQETRRKVRRAAAGERDAPRPDRDGYRLEDQIGHLLRRAHQRHVAIFQRIFGEDGPTPTQFATLNRLYERRTLSQNELGRLTAMDPATIKGVVARLEGRGLIERRADPDDQRRVRLSLTAAGRALAARVIAQAEQATKATLEPLSREEAARLVGLLRRIS